MEDTDSDDLYPSTDENQTYRNIYLTAFYSILYEEICNKKAHKPSYLNELLQHLQNSQECELYDQMSYYSTFLQVMEKKDEDFVNFLTGDISDFNMFLINGREFPNSVFFEIDKLKIACKEIAKLFKAKLICYPKGDQPFTINEEAALLLIRLCVELKNGFYMYGIKIYKEMIQPVEEVKDLVKTTYLQREEKEENKKMPDITDIKQVESGFTSKNSDIPSSSANSFAFLPSNYSISQANYNPNIYSNQGKYGSTCEYHSIYKLEFFCPQCRKYRCEQCTDEHSVITPGMINCWIAHKRNEAEIIKLQAHQKECLAKLEEQHKAITKFLSDKQIDTNKELSKLCNIEELKSKIQELEALGLTEDLVKKINHKLFTSETEKMKEHYKPDIDKINNYISQFKSTTESSLIKQFDSQLKI